MFRTDRLTRSEKKRLQIICETPLEDVVFLIQAGATEKDVKQIRKDVERLSTGNCSWALYRCREFLLKLCDDSLAELATRKRVKEPTP